MLEGGWVLGTDLSVEEVHFRKGWLSDREIGWRAAAAALSDLAAMAAEPVGLLVSMAMPATAHGEVVAQGVQGGIGDAAATYGAHVLGGDLSRSPGPLVIDVVVLGRAPSPVSPVLRAGARPGDELWVTGSLGAAAAAVRAWRAGAEPHPSLRTAFARPVPRVAEIAWLVRRAPLNAAIDVSDGLAGDAGHLAAASGARVVLCQEDVPVSERVLREVGASEALDLALHGGEDYEVLVAVPAGALDDLVSPFARAFDVRLSRVGGVTEGSGVWLSASGQGCRRLHRAGHDHLEPLGP